jgi:hypothetical protein
MDRPHHVDPRRPSREIACRVAADQVDDVCEVLDLPEPDFAEPCEDGRLRLRWLPAPPPPPRSRASRPRSSHAAAPPAAAPAAPAATGDPPESAPPPPSVASARQNRALIRYWPGRPLRELTRAVLAALPDDSPCRQDPKACRPIGVQIDMFNRIRWEKRHVRRGSVVWRPGRLPKTVGVKIARQVLKRLRAEAEEILS